MPCCWLCVLLWMRFLADVFHVSMCVHVYRMSSRMACHVVVGAPACEHQWPRSFQSAPRSAMADVFSCLRACRFCLSEGKCLQACCVTVALLASGALLVKWKGCDRGDACSVARLRP